MLGDGNRRNEENMGESSLRLPGLNNSAASSHRRDPSSPSERRAEPVAVVETAFMKLVGRRPSEEERQRLYRLRDGLALQDNDAIWSIIMALDHYDALYRLYPAQIASQMRTVTEQAMDRARATVAAMAAEESAHAHRTLADMVARTSTDLACKLADKPIGLHRFSLALACVVGFGALCVRLGYDLAAHGSPFWVVPPHAPRTPLQQLLCEMLSMPAGWMVFAMLLPAAGATAKFGWTLAIDPLRERRERLVGWCIVVCCALAAAGCAVGLARIA
jgi:hypothetical protein